jgi:hypothetical protein
VALQNQRLAVRRTRNFQRGVPVDWPRHKVHAALASGMRALLDCDSVVLHECAGPWQRLLSLNPGGGGMRELPAGRGIVGFVLHTGAGRLRPEPPRPRPTAAALETRARGAGPTRARERGGGRQHGDDRAGGDAADV